MSRLRLLPGREGRTVTASIRTASRRFADRGRRSLAAAFMIIIASSLLGDRPVAPAFAAENAPARRILILDSFGRDVAPFNAAASAFRTTLARELGQPVDIHQVSLDSARFAETGSEEAIA